MMFDGGHPSDPTPAAGAPTLVTVRGLPLNREAAYTALRASILKGGNRPSPLRGAFGLDRIWSLFRQNAAWSVTILAATIVSIKIFFAAEGDLNVATAIVSTSSTSTVLFGIAVQALSAIFTGTPVLWISIAQNAWMLKFRERALSAYDPDPESTPPPLWTPRTTWSLVILTFLLVIVFFVGNWIYSITAAFLLLLAVVVIRSDISGFRVIAQSLFDEDGNSDSKPGSFEFLAKRPFPFDNYLVGLVLGLVIIVFTSTMWLPAQRFDTKQGSLVGYQLAASSKDRTVLLDSPRLPVVVSESDLKGVTYCEIWSSTNAPSAFTEIFHVSVKQLPQCYPAKPKRAKS
jgi:hypothetical protein